MGLRRVVSEGARKVGGPGSRPVRVPPGPPPSWRAHLAGPALGLGQGEAPGPRPARDPGAHGRSAPCAATCAPRRGLMERATAGARTWGTVERSLQEQLEPLCDPPSQSGAPFLKPRRRAGCADTRLPPGRSQFVKKKGEKKRSVKMIPRLWFSLWGNGCFTRSETCGALECAPRPGRA